jgi:HEAT repeat protein
LLETLKDDQVEVRRAAILALGRLGKGNLTVEQALKKFAEDSDSPSRIDATIALAGIEKADESVIPTLLQALAGKEKPTAKLARRVLAQMGRKAPEKVLPGLMEALEKKQEPVAGYAVNVLRAMKTAAAPALVNLVAFYDDADPETRLDIVDAVTSIDKGGDYAVPVLIKSLKADDALDRKEALLGLMRYRDKSDLYMDHLIAAVKDEDAENRLLSVGVIRGLGNKSAKAVPALIDLTQDSDLRVRRGAILAFGSLKPPPKEIVPALEKCLQDKNVRIRIIAASALGHLGNTYPEEAAKLLEEALKTETQPQAKSQIETVLKRLTKSQAGKVSAVREKVDDVTKRPH